MLDALSDSRERASSRIASSPGAQVPYATVLSINFWICVFAPPVVATATARWNADPMRVMIPGVAVMALAPLAPLLAPARVGGVVAWVVLLSVGEVVWSPRSTAYVASLAPAGREGAFMQLTSWPTFLSKLPAGRFAGALLGYVPNCRSCQGADGRFCDAAAPSGNSTALACFAGARAVCDGVFAAPGAASGLCPRSCSECPGWHGDARMLWAWVLGPSLVSPAILLVLKPWLSSRPGVSAAAAKRGYVSVPDVVLEETRAPLHEREERASSSSVEAPF